MNQKNLIAATLACLCAMASSTTQARNQPVFDGSFTLAANDAVVPGGSGPSDSVKNEDAELAQQLQNPVAALISVPIQNNWDFGIGPAHAMRYTANIQPVLPIGISEDWNLIIRTITPVIYAEAVDNRLLAPASARQSHAGLGDITQTFFLSPKNTVGGWVLAAGPVALWPTASDSVLGAGQWGAGPSALALRQENGFTYGLLVNHLWSYAGWGDQNVNATFLQPFVAFTTKTFTTFSVNTESTYDWQAEEALVPMNFGVQQLVKLGKQPVAFQAGYRYYVEKPNGGPDWGLRFTITFLFPK